MVAGAEQPVAVTGDDTLRRQNNRFCISSVGGRINKDIAGGSRPLFFVVKYLRQHRAGKVFVRGERVVAAADHILGDISKEVIARRFRRRAGRLRRRHHRPERPGYAFERFRLLAFSPTMSQGPGR